MKPSILLFVYGAITGVAIVEAIVGEWPAVLCAALGLIMIRLATQGGEP